MVMDKPPVPGRPTIWMIVGQGPIALAVDAGGGCLGILLSSISSLLSPPRYRLKYCLKLPLNLKQPKPTHGYHWRLLVVHVYSGFVLSFPTKFLTRSGTELYQLAA